MLRKELISSIENPEIQLAAEAQARTLRMWSRRE